MKGSGPPDSINQPVENASAPIDWAMLRRQSGGDQALEGEVLELFVEECRRMERITAGHEPGALPAAAHRLKGTARSVGANRLADACEAVEFSSAPDAALKRLRGEVAAAREAAMQRLVGPAGAS